MIEQEQFVCVPGYQLARSLRFISDRPGVYVILVRNGDNLLKAMGYSGDGEAPLWRSSDGRFTHLYTGCSGNLRSRIKKHLVGDTRTSSFRKSLLAAEAKFGAIESTGHPLPIAPNDEFGLTLWLGANSLVGFKRCLDYRIEEGRLLGVAPSPLNITGRSTTPFARKLARIRDEYDQLPIQRWSHDTI
jgi:hypothetical protein